MAQVLTGWPVLAALSGGSGLGLRLPTVLVLLLFSSHAVPCARFGRSRRSAALP